MVYQKEIVVSTNRKGIRLITNVIENELDIGSKSGILHVFVKHSSAGITINENADPSVRTDFENYFNKYVPENEAYYTHIFEGADDMPAHIKTSLVGNSVTIPVTNGRLNLGTWQGIWLCEFRNRGSNRKIVLTFINS